MEAELIVQKIRNRLTYLRNRQAIRKYDRHVDHSSWSGADFYENYFTPFALPQPRGEFAFGAWRDLDISDEVGAFAGRIITDFKDRIVGFLGDQVRLDDIYVFWYDPEKRDNWSYSNSWHDDNVGHRIKIFACFEGNGSTPTVVLPNSYNKPYRRRPEERQRFAGALDRDHKPGEKVLAYKSGDVAIFDTSCLHRGLYEEPAAQRTVLVMEFIDRNKCNEIAGILPCAPGMRPDGKIVLRAGACQSLADTGLLDSTLLRKADDHYIYSLENRRRPV